MKFVTSIWNYFFTPSPIRIAEKALRDSVIGKINSEQSRDWAVAMVSYHDTRETALRSLLATLKGPQPATDPLPPAPPAGARLSVVTAKNLTPEEADEVARTFHKAAAGVARSRSVNA